MDPEEEKISNVDVPAVAEDAPPVTESEIPSELPPETPAEEAPVAKHKYADRLSQAFPDRKFEKDEDYEAAMDEHLSGLETYKERGQIANEQLLNMFESEPEVAGVVRDMIAGATFREALAKYISPEDIMAIEGDPDFEGWSKNKAAREESKAKRMKMEEEYSNNLNLSQQEIQAFAQENNVDEGAVGELIDKIDGILQDFQAGRITRQHLAMMNKALNFDSAVADAATTGEIAGRNQKIVAEKGTIKEKGDGMPVLASGNEMIEKKTPAPSYFDDLYERTRKNKVLD